ncbi:hypothetical protein, partial [uncultured Adlercreutzia sp.]|uniref:hypothetical protein n=1 Tax=uncultured Adlercreutzia sp. TaxID=875803 RepID=UPI0025FD28A3
ALTSSFIPTAGKPSSLVVDRYSTVAIRLLSSRQAQTVSPRATLDISMAPILYMRAKKSAIDEKLNGI